MKKIILASVVLILIGGGLTTWTGQHGKMALAAGESSSLFVADDGKKLTLPFSVTLDTFEVVTYPGTEEPMDYVSHLTIRTHTPQSLCDAGEAAQVSMNHIFRYRRYRFYQHDFDGRGGTTLLVVHDPWGIGVTYAGYLAMVVGLAWGFLSRQSRFRRLLRGAVVVLMLVAAPSPSATAASNTLPRETARAMGRMYVQYQGRVCPVQTPARNFSLDDFNPSDQFATLKLFPLRDSAGTLAWYAQDDPLPLNVTDEEYIFVRKWLSYCQELVVMGDYDELARVFTKTREWQERQAAGVLPSAARVNAEYLYNALATGRWLAMLCLVLGLVAFVVMLRRPLPAVRHGLLAVIGLVTLYCLTSFVLRWIIGGHVPMAGTFDTLNLLTILIGIVVCLMVRRHGMVPAIGLLAMGFCQLMAMKGGSNPPVTYLMPVLNTPLLSLHVTVIMMAYALFLLVALNSVLALVSPSRRETAVRTSLLMLYPGVALLAVGIIIGAVWANISWGAYWSWDPKEVWALITLIVYTIPLALQSTPPRRVLLFHIYCLLAFLSVLVTYFGVNLLFGGMHAYS